MNKENRTRVQKNRKVKELEKQRLEKKIKFLKLQKNVIERTTKEVTEEFDSRRLEKDEDPRNA